MRKYFLPQVIFITVSIVVFFSVFFIFGSLKLSDLNFAGEITPSKKYKNIEKNIVKNRINFLKSLKISSKYNDYIPYIEQKLKENNIPDDFKYIAIIESSLDINAVSHQGALGLWQFMPETGTRFGLVINEEIDERRDYIKSTDAAIEYFKVLYEKFGNWTLVAAAYNRGENAIAKALKSQGVNSFYDLELNPETSNYIFRLLSEKYGN